MEDDTNDDTPEETDGLQICSKLLNDKNDVSDSDDEEEEAKQERRKQFLKTTDDFVEVKTRKRKEITPAKSSEKPKEKKNKVKTKK